MRGWNQRAGTLLVVLLTVAALLISGPALLAQDEDQPDGQQPLQEQASSHVYLPAVAGGAALEAGTIIPGQFIVVLKQPAERSAAGAAATTEALAAGLSASVNGDVLYVYDAALYGFAVRVPAETAQVAASSLAADPNVAYVEPDRVARAIETNDTQTGATWGLDRIDQRDLPLNSTFTFANRGAGVHAYIIDTGIRPTHSQFTGRVGNGYSAINDGRGFTDCNGHGTHVAGTVGGTTHGVAKQVMLHGVRVLDCGGSGTNAGVIAGVNWVAANHVKPAVANMSLGGGASSALDSAVSNSIAAGVTYAVAAGNENQNACNVSPARTAAALTVGSTTSTDARSSFSNFGACVDIFAPGSSIASAWYTSDTATNTISGTSMASPHMAGAAALYLAANPSASPSQVAQALTGNATTNKVTNPGTGSPNRLLFVGFIGGGTPAPTPTATATRPPATATPVRTPTPTATPAPSTCANLLKNPGFESGRVNWTESSTNGFPLICTPAGCGSTLTPRTGSYYSWLAGADSEASQISQSVTLPAGQKTTLSFWHRIVSSDSCGYDYGYVRVTSNGVTTNVKTYNLCTTTQTSGWVNTKIDLSSYAGRTITLSFRATTDVSLESSFFVDDTQLVSGNTCVVTSEGAIETPAQDSGEDIIPSQQPKADVPAGSGESRR
jgi:subtilisin family serine protease